MRTIADWFELYGESHRNPVNKRIHWACVPLIQWSVLALLWAAWPPAAVVVIVAAIAFYAVLSPPLAFGMLGVSALMCAPFPLIDRGTLAAVAIAVFVGAWIGQFIGHRIEGHKPSFLDDVKFLLIGPAWLLGFIYRAAGIRY